MAEEEDEIPMQLIYLAAQVLRKSPKRAGMFGSEIAEKAKLITDEELAAYLEQQDQAARQARHAIVLPNRENLTGNVSYFLQRFIKWDAVSQLHPLPDWDEPCLDDSDAESYVSLCNEATERWDEFLKTCSIEQLRMLQKLLTREQD